MCWVFVSVRGLSPVAASGGHSSSQCAGLSLSRPLVVEHGLQTRRLSSCGSRPSCSAACGIFPDRGSNPCPLNWQADSQPLRHQGSPTWFYTRDLSICRFWYLQGVLEPIFQGYWVTTILFLDMPDQRSALFKKSSSLFSIIDSFKIFLYKSCFSDIHDGTS